MLIKKHEKIILISLYIGLIILFSFIDLNFTKLIYNQSSLFGQFFFMFGELPGTFVGLACFSILTTSYTNDNPTLSDLNRIIFGLITFILSFILSFQMIRYLKLELFPFIFVGMIISMSLIYHSNQFSDEKKKHIRVYALIGALTMILGILVPNLIKIIWARPRYRIFNGDDILYRAWYIRSGFTFDDNWKSFPSGHSAAATISLVYIYLPQLFDKLKGKERKILIITSIWIVLVMISRVIVGDHFVSDTLFGTGITLLIFIGLNKLFNVKL